jgi:hypothetical protein
MNKKEMIIRLIRSICLTVVFGFIVMTIFAPLLPPDFQATSQILETEEGVGVISAIIFFFMILLVPLPNIKQNLLVVVRSIFVTLLVSYLFFVGGRQIDGMHPVNILIIMVPLLLIGLILFSWKSQLAE